ncbi:LacI family DNA-binding transcriptional regulator [Xylophilus sp. GOD-11R]|uniref:LacI family DNA-binding transcriptional regulator n=1 Tax=Xylophilus sp. GOD-11R TaxID=3089814 RepID=UPI00298C602E|nr:LacI family DNA-binding transcriptional regulator [Xylophilus sp. GOD-11R]WPB56520.1 LacI family DNA-binding transcriptional regulator [Xylophilus sp. GOD-11R]
MTAPRKRAATLRDVAEAAGVSTATVSKFVNGNQRFTAEVEARIAQAVERLGYSLNPMARGMITGQTGNVGIIILDIRNPHFTSLVKGASRVAAGAGLNLIIADAAESTSPELGLLQSLMRRVDGLVVSARLPAPVIDALQTSGIPVVFYGRPAALPSGQCVGCDNHTAGLMLGRHLRELGHRRLCYLGFSGARWSEERAQGLAKAFEGVADARLRIVDAAAPSTEEGERLASTVLLSEEMDDAVVAYNDLLALGLLLEARSLGIRVPEQLSIAGFDNIAYGRLSNPALTSVDMMGEATGELAMRKLVGVIQGTPTSTEDHTLPSRIVVRESTAARPGRVND